MGITRALVKVPGILVALLIGLAAGLSTLGVVWWIGPEARSFAHKVVEHYDTYVPEISFQGGLASIKKAQPYYVDFGQKGDPTIVIDTREGHQNEGMNYLKDVKDGFVLTRDSVITKSDGQIRIVPLKGMPDLTINSGSLRALVDRYFPTLQTVVAGVVVMYFLLSKTFQVLVLAIIPYLWVRRSDPQFTYGRSFKVAVFCMIPPVLLNVFQDLTGNHFPARFWIYCAVYLIFLVLASVDLSRSAQPPQDASGGIGEV